MAIINDEKTNKQYLVDNEIFEKTFNEVKENINNLIREYKKKD